MEHVEEPQITEPQRSEEPHWTERQEELAKEFGVEPKTVQLLRQIVEDVLAVREHSAEAGEFDRERLLSLRFDVPVQEKLRELGGLTAALLEHMLKSESKEKVTPEPTAKEPVPDVEAAGDSMLKTIKRWLSSRLAGIRRICKPRRAMRQPRP